MGDVLDGMQQAGQHLPVLQEAEDLFRRKGRAPAEAARVAARAAHAAGALRQWGKAVAWCDRGLALLPGGGVDPQVEASLRFYAGTALMYTGDLLRAEQELTRVLEISARYGVLLGLVGDIHFNLGYLMRSLKRQAAEVVRLRAAAQAYAEAGRHNGVVACHYEIAWSLLLAGHLASGLAELNVARQGLAEHGDPELAVDVEIATALHHRLSGEWEKAADACRELLEREPGMPARQRADVAWLLADAALTAGNLPQARRYTADAYEAAMTDWWPPQMERIAALRERLLAWPATAGQ